MDPEADSHHMEKDRLPTEAHVEGNHMVHYALVEDNHPVEGTLQEGIPKGGIRKGDIPKGGIPQVGIPQVGILKVGVLKVGILKETGHVKYLRTALCHFARPLVVVYHLLPFLCILQNVEISIHCSNARQEYIQMQLLEPEHSCKPELCPMKFTNLKC